MLFILLGENLKPHLGSVRNTDLEKFSNYFEIFNHNLHVIDETKDFYFSRSVKVLPPVLFPVCEG